MAGENNAGNSDTSPGLPTINEILKFIPCEDTRPLRSKWDEMALEIWKRLGTPSMWIYGSCKGKEPKFEKPTLRMADVRWPMSSQLKALKHFFMDFELQVEFRGATLGGPKLGFTCAPPFAGIVHPTKEALEKVADLKPEKQKCVLEFFTAPPTHERKGYVLERVRPEPTEDEPPHALMGPLLAAYAMAYCLKFDTACLRFAVLLKPDASYALTQYSRVKDFKDVAVALRKFRSMRPTRRILPVVEDLNEQNKATNGGNS
jgi:hypothetical protein